jgi:hypothetical protein
MTATFAFFRLPSSARQDGDIADPGVDGGALIGDVAAKPACSKEHE